MQNYQKMTNRPISFITDTLLYRKKILKTRIPYDTIRYIAIVYFYISAHH